MQRVLDWPVREVLLSYVAQLKSAESANYRSSLLIWAAKTCFSPKAMKKPDVPAILKEK